MSYSGIANIVVQSLFGFAILMTLLGALVGLMKGIYKTSLKTVLKFIMVFALVFLTPSISGYIGNFSFPNPAQPGTNTTILSFIANALQQTDMVSPINGISIYQTCILLATSLLSFATFFVGLILIQLFAWFITAVFYHGIFRWFLPVETAKERKQRKKAKKQLREVTDRSTAKASVDNSNALTAGILDDDGEAKTQTKVHKKLPLLRGPGFLLGGVQEFVFVLCLLAPITGLSRVVISHKDTVNKAMTSFDLSQEQSEEISGAITVVENSLIYKLLGVGDFDQKLMNQVSNVTLNNTSVNLGGLASTLLDIANPLLSDGTISYDKAAGIVTVNFSALLSVSTVQSLLDELNSPMILALIPPLIDVAMNSIGENAVAVDGLDFSNINWESDLSLLKDIYASIYDGAIKPIVSGNQINPMNFSLKTSTMTDAEIANYVDACRNLGKMESVQKNLPNILSAVGHLLQSQGLAILPTDPADYENVNFSEDLPVFADVILNFFRVIGMDITPNLNTTELQERTMEVFKNDTERNQIADLVCGSSDGKEGLLDTNLVSALSLGTIVNSVLSTIPSLSEYVKGVDIKSVIDSLDKVGRKNEFRHMFDIAGKASEMDLGDLKNVDFTDPKFAEQLDELLGLAMESQIFNRLYPSVMKAVLFHSNGELSANLYGLSAYNFNFESETFLEDFRSILALLPDLAKMQEKLADSSLSNADKLKSLDVECVKELLYVVIGSDFLNSDQKTGVTSHAQKNANIYTLFTNFFADEPFRSIGFKVPSREEFEQITWGDGQTKGEIDVLGNIIEDAKANADFLTSSDMNLANLQDPGKLADIAVQGFDSQLLSPSILSIIDSSLNQYMQKLGFQISINEMRNELWKEDMNSLEDVLVLLKDINLDDLDINTLNPKKLNALLTILSNMNIVRTSNDFSDPFGYVLYNILEKQGLFEKIGVKNLSLAAFNTNDTWSIEKGTWELENGDSFVITTKGEIHSICYLLEVLQKYGLDDFMENGLPTGISQDIIKGGDDVLNSVLIRSILTKEVQNTISGISFGSEYDQVLKSIDYSSLMTMSAEQFGDDLKMFESIYQMYKDVIVVDGVEESKIEYALSHIFSLKSIITGQRDDGSNITLFDEFSDLIHMLTNSTILNSIPSGKASSPLMNIFAGIVRSLSLEKNVTFISDDARVDEALLGLLGQIAYEDKFEKEGNSLLLVIESLQGLNSDQVSLLNGLTLEQAKSVFYNMNRSEVFHKVPISLIEEAFTTKNIDSYLKDPDTGAITATIDYKVHLTCSQEDIEFWDNEYSHLIEMLLGEGGLSDVFANPDLSFTDINFDTIDPVFLYHFGSMKIFEASRSYIFYNIADSYRSSSDSQSPAEMIFKPAENVPYGENAKVYRLEELFFRNPKLMTNGVLDKEKCITDLALFKSVADLVLKNVVNVSDTEDIASVSINFEDLVNSCYTYQEDTFYRSDLASEIVAGMLMSFFNNPNLPLSLEGHTLDFYKDDHALVNTIEGRAFNGIVAYAQKISPTFLEYLSGNFTNHVKKSDVIDVYTLFGMRPESTEDVTTRALLKYFYENSCHSDDTGTSLIYQSFNSLIGLQFQSVILSSTIVKEPDGLISMTLSKVMENHSIVFTNFYQVAQDISAYIL